MMLARHVVVGLCTARLCLGAQAQVARCTDARTGKVGYADGLCSSGEAAREVTIRPGPEEVLRHQQREAAALERSRQRLQVDHGAAQADAQRAADDRQRAFAEDAPRRYGYARSPGCAGSRGSYELLRIQQNHRSTREYAPLKENAQRRMDMDCMGPEACAERERQREQDRREQVRRDQVERDRRAAADRARNEGRPVQSGLSLPPSGWRSSLRSSP